MINALRLATLELSSIPIVKNRLFPTTSTTIDLEEGVTEYDLPDDYNYNINSVTYDSSANISSQRDLAYGTSEEIFSDLQDLGASVERYTVRGTKLIIAGTPSSGEVGKLLKITYAELPDVSLIQNDGTETLLGKKYPHVLIDMAIRRFLLTEPDLAPVADRYQQLVDGHKEDIRQELETVSARGEFAGDTVGPF